MEIAGYQDQRLREILHHYDLEDPYLEALQNHENLVMRVKTCDSSYVLRVCDPATTAERVQEILDWLLALRRDTDLIVPSPVANVQGTYITSWAEREQAPVHLCVLFNWIEGESVRHHMSQEVAAAIGSIIARLHRHAQSYTPTCKGRFAGRRYDIGWLIGPTSWWSSGRARHGLGSDTYARLVPAIEVAAEAMARYGEVPEHFGVIHADLHFDNILVDNNRYSVIDFGDCSLGYYFHDLAIVEQVFRNRAHDQRCIAAFHEHYCRERGISTLLLRDLDAFMIVADVIFLEWVLSSDNPEIRELCLPRVSEKIEHIVASAERAKRTI